jgi:alanine dehydrogenase
VAGVPSAEVVIVGAGVVGTTAAHTFTGVGAHVTLMDIDLQRLQHIQNQANYPMVTMLSNDYNIGRACAYADVLIGAVLVPGERAPVIVSRQMVRTMKPRAVVIDMSIDQGGCVETSRPTNHGSPTYEEEGVIHYCVPNMSGVLGRTASHALFIGAYPYLETIAQVGVQKAIQQQPALERGISLLDGKIHHLKRLISIGGDD